MCQTVSVSPFIYFYLLFLTHILTFWAGTSWCSLSSEAVSINSFFPLSQCQFSFLSASTSVLFFKTWLQYCLWCLIIHCTNGRYSNCKHTHTHTLTCELYFFLVLYTSTVHFNIYLIANMNTFFHSCIAGKAKQTVHPYKEFPSPVPCCLYCQ